MFLYLGQMYVQHTQDLLHILVIILTDLLLLILDILPHILHQGVGQMGEIDDVVERVQDTVNQTLCQFAHSSHLLLPNQLLLRLFQLMEGLLQLGRFLSDLVTLRHNLLRTFRYHCL